MSNKNKWLVLIYPVFLFFICEMGHLQSFSGFFTFITESFGIVVFDVFLIAVLFATFAVVLKNAYVPAMIVGVIFYSLSAIEYYKFNISGTHFTITDISMTENLSDISHFANIKVNLVLSLCFLLLALYIYAIYKSKIEISLTLTKRVVSLTSCLCVLCASLLVPSFFTPICTCFGIIDQGSAYISGSSDNFDRNMLIASFAVSLNDGIKAIVKEPEYYTKEEVLKYTKTAEKAKEAYDKPNIVFVMSEAFADFRLYKKDIIPKGTYDFFDEVADSADDNLCVVPSFGGYTARTEFELMTGLPVKSLNSNPIPQNILSIKKSQPAFANIYRDMGYKTYYIHPFSKTFYSRDKYYPLYGFDNLIFDEEFLNPQTNERGYITDKEVFNKIENILQNEEQPAYIFTTTMQNHQPYNINGANEFNTYFSGIKETSKYLLEFEQWVKGFNENTVVVFVGDHFPGFSKDNTLYSDVNSDNIPCIQKYIVINNFGKSFKTVDTVSSFYIPHIIYEKLFPETNTFVKTILNEMDNTPLYTDLKEGIKKNKRLDIITYDRTLGERFLN